MARRLRIAVSVFFGLLTVALVVLWARSYTVSDFVSIKGRGASLRLAHVIGRTGIIFKEAVPLTQPLSLELGQHTVDTKEAFQELQSFPSFLGVAVERSGRGLLFVVPIWFLMLPTSSLAIVPCWHLLPGRFSLRTLFIATTLVAIILGSAVWMVS